MITKDAFVGIMNAMRDYYDSLTKLEDSLDIIFEDSWIIRVIDNILSALSDELEKDIIDDSDDSFIYTFTFTCDWGRDKDAKGIKVNKTCCDLDTAENLYDLLMDIRSKRNE